MANSIQLAFNQIVETPVACSEIYVVLWRVIPYYGGPEEGGWWGNDTIPEAFTICATESEANALHERIVKLADELSEQARRENYEICLAQLKWCEERGIEDSNAIFGEEDGPDRFYVSVQSEPPRGTKGPRHYE